MKKLLVLVLAGLLVPITVSAVPAPKYFVCKFTGTPGVNETLQTGQNPISVSGNALTPPIVIGGYFNDQHGRSLVVAEDIGQAEPTCPAPVNDPTPDPDPTPTPTPDPEEEDSVPNLRPQDIIDYPGVK